MPKDTRDRHKRQIGHALHNITVAQEHILSVKADFDPVHPDLGAILDQSMIGLECVSELIKAWALQCWGYVPEDVERWRQ